MSPVGERREGKKQNHSTGARREETVASVNVSCNIELIVFFGGEITAVSPSLLTHQKKKKKKKKKKIMLCILLSSSMQQKTVLPPVPCGFDIKI